MMTGKSGDSLQKNIFTECCWIVIKTEFSSLRLYQLMLNHISLNLPQRIDAIQDISYQPEIPQLKVRRQQRNRWSAEQNHCYTSFLKQHVQMFESEESRRGNKVFRMICDKIKTRTIHQVKSHHQKMIKKHKSISGIIEFNQKKELLLETDSPCTSTDCNSQQISPKHFTPTQSIFHQQASLLQKCQSPVQQTDSHTFLYWEFLRDDNWFLDL